MKEAVRGDCSIHKCRQTHTCAIINSDHWYIHIWYIIQPQKIEAGYKDPATEMDLLAHAHEK